MGYWSEHPMGGDLPMDLEGELLEKYMDNETCEYPSDLAKRITDDLKELVEQAKKTDNFTLPWIIVEHEIIVPIELRDEIRELISDGDGTEREYSQTRKATLKNKWNKFQCPMDYCDQLRSYWNDIVSGKVKAEDVLVEDLGLIATMIKKAETSKKPGLINVA